MDRTVPAGAALWCAFKWAVARNQFKAGLFIGWCSALIVNTVVVLTLF